MSSFQKKFGSLYDRHLFHLQNSLANFRQLQQIHTLILTSPSLQSNSILAHFLSSCARSQKFDYATPFVLKLQQPGSFVWNLIIRLSLELNLEERVLYLYNKMLNENILPHGTTFSVLLRGCTASSLVTVGRSVHCHILKWGFGLDMFLLTGLLDFYGKAGDLSSAKRIFWEMPERDIITQNAMIVVLSKHDCANDARKLFDEMVERSSSSWNSMITCYCKCGDIDSARAIFDENPFKDVVSWNAMVGGYCKTGQLVQALELFDQMGFAKNSVTWNTMISGCVQCREFAKAITIFQQIQMQNVRSTEVTMVNLLSACAHMGALDMGRWIHTYVKHHRFTVDVILGNALIDMYSKCGIVESALEVFHGLGKSNIYCWNSIIVGLGMHGYGQDAIDAFLAMEKERVMPDGVTFVGLLCGCSHSGLVSEGRDYFFQMCKLYGIELGIEHYGCMVDLLGRAGSLKESLELIGAMPMRPNAVVWGSFLRACKIHNDTKLSEQVTNKLLHLDPHDGGNYVALSNIYASMNCWDGVDFCRRMMLEKGVHKTPGCSSIEVSNVIHEFVVGDTSHPQFSQIYAFLVKVLSKLKDLGHEADTTSVLHDIEEEEKENAVQYHNEKIAIAFGLMTVGLGKPIRVVKNLRMCGDCHSYTKLVSKLFDREIIVRDRNRFHHFKDGSCSCNDYCDKVPELF